MSAPPPQTRDKGSVIFEGKPSCCAAFGDWCKKTRWVITTTYIERESGICCSSIDNLELVRVKDMTYHGCCCCGTIVIYSTDETTPVLYIKGLANGADIYHKIRDAVSAVHTGNKLDLQMK